MPILLNISQYHLFQNIAAIDQCLHLPRIHSTSLKITSGVAMVEKHQDTMYLSPDLSLRPHLYGYVFMVFMENDIVFNENATIALHLHIASVSFSYRFHIVFISFV